MIEMITEHFAKSELMCPCCGECEMDADFMGYLEKLRIEMDKPMIVASGYRCEKHNKECGGKDSSKHLIGQAVDIHVPDSTFRYLLIENAIFYQFFGIGIGKTFVHIDGREDDNPVCWTY